MEQPCTGGKMCFLPGESIGCGMCQKPPNACQSDADCPAVGGKPKICLYKKSDCTCSGEKLCHSGCTADGDCAGPWQICGGNHHCIAKPCNAASDCPALFKCDAGGCLRQNCQTSAKCPGGHCVKGKCYGKAGYCSFLPP